MKEWLSVHLFFAGSLSAFIVEAIVPFLQYAKRDGFIDRYFFIRYGEGGQHIRLRFYTEKQKHEELKALVSSMFSDYFQHNPSKRKYHTDRGLYPNNSVQYIDYEPETDRYGGVQALMIAENQFMVSSETIIEELLKHREKWTYDLAIGTGFKLHVGFAKAAGIPALCASFFFQCLANSWISKASKVFQNKSKNQFAETRTIFENLFQQGKSRYLEYTKAIFEAGRTEWIEDPILKKWIESNERICRSFQCLQAEGNINYPPCSEAIKKNTCFHPIWPIYFSLLHMTNNRLGVGNRDEAFLFYLLYRSFGWISKN
ncbi:MAG: thiopeptide-type bacteriocin biosynthesis protein [Phaeodactylibacter sp.]|nr:thiopeptide-type bacteriocin biosynthesis protein [Phaeodactylibacter sp.]